MRKLTFFSIAATVAAGLMFFTSCGKGGGEKEVIKPALSIDSELIEFGDGDTSVKEVKVTTNSQTWSATTSADWLTLERHTDGKTLLVSVKSLNHGDDARNDEITFTAAGIDPVVLPVRQETTEIGPEPRLSIDSEGIEFESDDDTSIKEVKVTTNVDRWTATTSADWLTLQRHTDGETLLVSVDELNYGDDVRSAEITFSAEGVDPVVLPVEQLVSIPIMQDCDVLGYLMYYGNAFRNGNAQFMFNFFNSRTNVGLNVTGFSPLPDDGYDGFTMPVGTYVINETCEVGTMLPGITRLSPFGTWIYENDGTAITEIIITGGTLEISLDGDTYTVDTDFSGYERANPDNTMDKLRMRYRGPVDPFTTDLRDYSSDIYAKDLPGSYSARGTANYNETNPGPGSWTGTIAPVSDSKDRFTFSGGYLDHWCYLENSELYLDGNTSIVKSKVDEVDVDVYVRAFVVVDGRLFWVYRNDGEEGEHGYDYPIRNAGGGRLTFRNRMESEDGRQHDVMIGAVGIDAQGEIYVMSECYKDLEYEVDGLKVPVESIVSESHAPAMHSARYSGYEVNPSKDSSSDLHLSRGYSFHRFTNR